MLIKTFSCYFHTKVRSPGRSILYILYVLPPKAISLGLFLPTQLPTNLKNVKLDVTPSDSSCYATVYKP